MKISATSKAKEIEIAFIVLYRAALNFLFFYAQRNVMLIFFWTENICVSLYRTIDNLYLCM